MFPQNNFHYAKHYNVGYGNCSYVKNTEYQVQYAGESSLNENSPAQQKHDSIVNPKLMLERTAQMNVEDRATRLEKAKAKHRLEQQKKKLPELNDNQVILSTMQEQKQNTFKVNNFIVNGPQSPKAYVRTPESKAPAQEFKAPLARHSKTPMRNYLGTPLELAEEKPREDMRCPVDVRADYTPPAGANHRLSEKRLRARKYKEYLDLQTRYNNERAEYDRQEKKRAHELFNRKNEELRKMEKLLAMEDMVFKKQLAKEYQREMEELKINNPHKQKYPADNICNLLEINQKRYFDVTPVDNVVET